MELINLEHANMRDEAGKPVPITIVKDHVFSWYYSTSTKCLHIVSNGGSVVPVLSTPDEFKTLYQTKSSQGEQNAPVQSAS